MRADIAPVLAAILVACTYGQDSDVIIRTQKLTFAQDIWPLLVPYLNGSEHQASSRGSSGLLLTDVAVAYNNLINVQSKTNPPMKLVVPGNHNQSFLWIKLNGGPDLVGDRMPANNGTVFGDVQIAEVKAWIDEGALFSIDEKGVTSLPGPNGGVIRGGNVVSPFDSTILAVLGTLAVIVATASYMYIKT